MASTTVGRYFRGDLRPSLEFVEGICKMTGCHSDWLLFGNEPIFPRMPKRAAELAVEYGYLGRPVRETAYKCWRCRGSIERAADVCPHCAAILQWADFRERQEDALPV